MSKTLLWREEECQILSANDSIKGLFNPPFSNKRAQLTLLSEQQAEVEQTAPPTCAEETVFVHFNYKSSGFQRCAAAFFANTKLEFVRI